MTAEADRSLHILQINTADIGGGAEKSAWSLFQAYRARGHAAWLAVGRKCSDEPSVLAIPSRPASVPWARLCQTLCKRLEPLEERTRVARRLGHWLRTLAQGTSGITQALGHEDFNSPGSRGLLALVPRRPDVIHGHNLHGRYFDLRILPWLSQHIPVVLTLHDAWLLGGHCVHSFDCERWRTGCGECPDLSIHVAIRRDASAYNWRRKKRIYQKSRLFVITPSHWLMRKVERSMLVPAIVEARVIPNGVDLSIFRPADKRAARAALGIPQQARVLLFTANRARRNAWKDYPTVISAVSRAADRARNQDVLLIALGEDAPPEQVGHAQIRYVPFQQDCQTVADYYRAADIYVHAARADTFPRAVLEALACGTPVVATAVGGIPEQIEDGVTGFLTPPSDSEAMSRRIYQLLKDAALQQEMARQAVCIAQRRFDLERQVDDYLDFYERSIL